MTEKEIKEIISCVLDRYANATGQSVSAPSDGSVFAEASAVLEDIIREHQPDYLETYFDVMEGKSMYRFHMFVTHRWILESYCEWLFSFLPEAVRRLRPERFEGFTRQRVLGFFGERLLTVWLLHQNLRIMELPVVEVRNG